MLETRESSSAPQNDPALTGDEVFGRQELQGQRSEIQWEEQNPGPSDTLSNPYATREESPLPDYCEERIAQEIAAAVAVEETERESEEAAFE